MKMKWMLAALTMGALCASGALAAQNTVGWAAWRDPNKRRLHVVGAVLAPHPGYVARLKPAEPQGFNAHQYLMNLVLEKRAGRWPTVPTYLPVEYAQDLEDNMITEVAVKSPDSLVAIVEVRTLGSAWKAWVEGKKHTLHVIGTVDAPNPGYDVKLKRVKSQDKNSGQYRLDLELTPPTKGMWTQVITPRQVSYTESGFKTDYARVAIRGPRGEVEIVPIERMR